MRYFFDTEFLEDGSTIELISIGIIAEDGREYYAEAILNPDVWAKIHAHEWLSENVVPHLIGFTAEKHRDQIADEIKAFVTGKQPEFWAYCGAYDWVVLNQLYGPMINHPTKWDFYCNDLRQKALELNISHRDFPEQTSTEHNALEDAKWNRQIFYWLEEQIN